jgi:hypothetical protein
MRAPLRDGAAINRQISFDGTLLLSYLEYRLLSSSLAPPIPIAINADDWPSV